MALGCYQFNAVDQQGNIAPLATVEVISESTGLLASVYSDRGGTTLKSNPFTADANGFVQFFVVGGAYKITVTYAGSSQVWRYVGIGTANETDIASLVSGLTPQGQWTTAFAYTGGTDLVTNRGSSYFCTTGHTSGASTEPGVGTSWTTVWQLMAERGGDSPKWRFDSSTTMADPGTGDIRFNSATLASVTTVAISNLSIETGNPSFDNWQLTWDDSSSAVKGLLTIRKVVAPEQYVQFSVTGLTDNAGWNQLAVTYTGSSGALFTNNDQVYISFSRTGDVGVPEGLTWTFNATTTIADPGAGLFRLNNASLSLVTVIAIDDQTNVTGNPNASSYVVSWGMGTSAILGYVLLKQVDAPQNFAVYALTGITDQSGYTELQVSHVVSNGALSGSTAIAFFKSGDKGDTGTAGPAGGIGSLGITKGNIPVADGSQYLELPSGADGTVMQSDSTQTQGVIYRTIGALLAKGSRVVTNLASAATCDIGNQATDYINITGSVGVTSFGTAINKIIKVRFAATPLITYNGTTLITPGLVSFTPQAGDEAVLASDGSGNWKFIGYTMANCQPQKIIRGDAVLTALSTAEKTVARLNSYSGAFDGAADLGLLTNPHFEISQENGTTLKSNIGATATYAADQWLATESAATLQMSVQNIASPFSGTANFKRLAASVKAIATTAQASLAAGEYGIPCEQRIEGSFLKHLGWGTADARAIDVAIILQASVTGTYCLAVRNGALDRSYVTTFSLTANTPTVVFVTIPGDTSGTWATDTGAGMFIDVGSIAGSTFQASSLNAWGAGSFISHSTATNWGATLNAFVQVAYCQAFPTGVLPFTAASQITGEALQRLIGARRPYDVEMRRCQRYWCKSARYGTAMADGLVMATDGLRASSTAVSATVVDGPPVSFPAPMRTPPTITYYKGDQGATNGQWAAFVSGTWTSATATTSRTVTETLFNASLTGTYTAGQSYVTNGSWSANARM